MKHEGFFSVDNVLESNCHLPKKIILFALMKAFYKSWKMLSVSS